MGQGYKEVETFDVGSALVLDMDDVSGFRTLIDVTTVTDMQAEVEKGTGPTYTSEEDYQIDTGNVCKNYKNTLLDALRLTIISNEAAGSNTVTVCAQVKTRDIDIIGRHNDIQICT